MKSNCTETNGHILDRERERYEAKEQRPKSSRQLRRAKARHYRAPKTRHSSGGFG